MNLKWESKVQSWWTQLVYKIIVIIHSQQLIRALVTKKEHQKFMKNIRTCDDVHYHVQQEMSWSRCKQENKKCLQVKDLNAKCQIWETWKYKVRLYMKWKWHLRMIELYL